MGLALLTPQFLHGSASVGNDALANLAGALLFRLACEAPFTGRSASLLTGSIAAVRPLHRRSEVRGKPPEDKRGQP